MWMGATHASVGSMEEPVQEDSVLRKRKELSHPAEMRMGRKEHWMRRGLI